jgi:sialate O-acetylesterase
MKIAWTFLVTLILLSCGSANKFDSEVWMSKIFSDGMVVQRDKPIVIWGKGIPGENIRVSLAGAISSGTVEADSSWNFQMPSLQAGGPFALQVNKQKFQDVYVGDVWLAGGQSNMEWTLKSSVIGAEEEFETNGFKEIRFFKVPNSLSVSPEDDVIGGSWKLADSVNMKDFSAIAWFFAKRNHLEKKVPVGIIESNWGGTPVEGWMDINVMANLKGSFEKDVKDIQTNQEKWIATIAKNQRNREIRDSMYSKPDSLEALKVASLDFNDSNWQKINLPTNNPLTQIAWTRKHFQLDEVSEEVILHLPTIQQMAYLYLNGKQIYYKNWGTDVPDLTLLAQDLHKGDNVLSIRAINSWDNKPSIGAKDEMYLLQNGKKNSLEGSWTYSNSMVEAHVPSVEWFNWKPGMMYNAMIHPLTNYGIKGVIWYQGESNAGRHAEYYSLFTSMIKSWREQWKQPNLPFLFVQLANFMKPEEVQPDSDWAFLRDAQTQTLALPHTGMAVIIDIGEENDIHPKNKKDVGDRLWLQAKNVAYGEKVLASGPQLDTLIRSGSELLLRFKSIGKGMQLTEGDQPMSFIFSDSRGKYHSAEAQLLDSATVKISLPENSKSGEVRYAWADNPAINLVNDIGLPAVPFRVEYPELNEN